MSLSQSQSHRDTSDTSHSSKIGTSKEDISTHEDPITTYPGDRPGHYNQAAINTTGTPTPSLLDDGTLSQLMQSQTKLLLSEMNKLLGDSHDGLKTSLEKNISISYNTAQISESLGRQLGDISSSLGLLQNKVTSLETSMKSKINEIEGRLDTYDNELHDIKTDQLKSTETSIQLCSDLTSLKAQVLKNTQMIEDLVNQKNSSDTEHQHAIAYRDGEIKDSQRRIDELEKLNSDLMAKMNSVDKSIYLSTKSCRKQRVELEAKIDLLDIKSRKNNIIIDGIQEASDENLELKILNLINAAGCEIQGADIHAIFRYGSAKGNKPRPIMVTFSSPKIKDIVIYNIREIKKKSSNKHLWFNKDQADATRRKTSLIKRCFALCKKHKYEATLKGDTIQLNGKSYKYTDLNLLPENCRPENTRMTYTEDGLGIGFNSEFVYLSNFYPCRVHYNNNTYSSAEQAFQHSKLIAEGYTNLASEVMDSDNPYEQKQTGGKIMPSESWIKSEVKVLKDIVKSKFEQNPAIRRRLLNSTFTKFYEMTTSLKWGTGIGNININKPLIEETLRGENRLGRILKEIKEELLGSQHSSS